MKKLTPKKLKTWMPLAEVAAEFALSMEDALLQVLSWNQWEYVAHAQLCRFIPEPKPPDVVWKKVSKSDQP